MAWGLASLIATQRTATMRCGQYHFTEVKRAGRHFSPNGISRKVKILSLTDLYQYRRPCTVTTVPLILFDNILSHAKERNGQNKAKKGSGLYLKIRV
ncbi:hypothetical protein J6590_070174 [Homalodisca vitripennis]|nr:hypothetical protein J6590_070174 [Homalodisca vitripennis]